MEAQGSGVGSGSAVPWLGWVWLVLVVWLFSWLFDWLFNKPQSARDNMACACALIACIQYPSTQDLEATVNHDQQLRSINNNPTISTPIR